MVPYSATLKRDDVGLCDMMFNNLMCPLKRSRMCNCPPQHVFSLCLAYLSALNLYVNWILYMATGKKRHGKWKRRGKGLSTTVRRVGGGEKERAEVRDVLRTQLHSQDFD